MNAAVVAGAIFGAACIVFGWLFFDVDSSWRVKMDGSYYIIRGVNSGVFVARGPIWDDKHPTVVKLEWSRMIWAWEGAAALSQVARDGITGGRVCVPVDFRIVLDVCEVLPCTPAAAENLLNQPEWVAR